MAAALHPWLGDGLLSEVGLVLMWFFHGLEAQAGDQILRATEHPNEAGEGTTVLSIDSAQRGWALQVLNIKQRQDGDWKLILSDSRHCVSAYLSEGARIQWEIRSGEAFEDIIEGTLLEIRDMVFEIRHRVASKKRQQQPTKVKFEPWLRLRNFGVIGCQGESIFGRPTTLLSDALWTSVFDYALIWWFGQVQRTPVPATYSRLLLKAHEKWFRSHGHGMSDDYVRHLREHFEQFRSHGMMAPISNLVCNLPSVNQVVSAALDRQMGGSGQIPRSTGRLRPGSTAQAMSQSTPAQPFEDADEALGATEIEEGTAHKDSDTEKKNVDAQDRWTISSKIRGRATLPGSSADPVQVVPKRSWKRRDGRVRSNQNLILKTLPWIPAPPGQMNPRASLPLEILEHLVSSGTPSGKMTPRRSDPRDSAAPLSEEPQATLEQTSAETQETIYPSDWSESPEPERRLPSDTDDEAGSPAELPPSRTYSQPSPPKSRDERRECDSSVYAEDYESEHDNVTNEKGSIMGTVQRQPNSASRKDHLAQPPTFAFGSSTRSSSSPAPATPTIQVPATAPMGYFVPDTEIKLGVLPSARKRRFEEPEVLDFHSTGLSQSQSHSPEDDPSLIGKRLRAEFFAEQKARREAHANTFDNNVPETRAEGPAPVHETSPRAAPPPPSLPTTVKAQSLPVTSRRSFLQVSPITTTVSISPPPRLRLSSIITTASISSPTGYSGSRPATKDSGSSNQNGNSPITPTSQPEQASPSLMGHAYRAFRQAHPDYCGKAEHFEHLSTRAAALIAQGFLDSRSRDKFILKHATDYKPYVEIQLAYGRPVVPYEDFLRERKHRGPAKKFKLPHTPLADIVQSMQTTEYHEYHLQSEATSIAKSASTPHELLGVESKSSTTALKDHRPSQDNESITISSTRKEITSTPKRKKSVPAMGKAETMFRALAMQKRKRVQGKQLEAKKASSSVTKPR